MIRARAPVSSLPRAPRAGGVLIGLALAGLALFPAEAPASVIPAAPGDSSATAAAAVHAPGTPVWPPLTSEDRQLTRFGGDDAGVTSPAVILFETADVDDRAAGGRRQTIHRRLKILSAAGVDRARGTIQLIAGRQRLTEFAGRTILPDGQQVPLEADKVSRRTLPGGREELEFQLARPGVGAILEYRYTIVGGPVPDQAGWIFQHEIPTLRSTYDWHPGPGRTSHWTLLKGDDFSPRIEPVTVPGHPDSLLAARFELHDLPAVPEEPWGPPFLETRARLTATYTDYPMSTDEYWNLFATQDRERVDRFIASRARLTEKLLAGGPAPEGFEAQTRRAFDFAQTVVSVRDPQEAAGPDSRSAIPTTADSVLARGSTNGEGVDLLFIAALAALDIHADRAFVVDRDQAFFHRDVPWAGQLSRSLVAVTMPGNRVLFFSPGTPSAPPGFIPWYTQGITALVATNSGARFAPTPVDDAPLNRTLRETDLRLDAEGQLTGRVQLTWSGQPEIDARMRWTGRGGAEERGRLQEEWRRAVAGISVDSLRVQNQSASERDLRLAARIKVPQYAARTDAGLLVNCAFLARESRNPFAAAVRRQPVFVPYPRLSEDHVALRPPVNWKPDSVPERIDFENQAGAYHVLWVWNGEALVYQRNFSLTAAQLSPADFPELRALYEQAMTGDGRLVSFVPVILPPSKRGTKP